MPVNTIQDPVLLVFRCMVVNTVFYFDVNSNSDIETNTFKVLFKKVWN